MKNVWKKWNLKVDDMQLTVPTKEHGIRLCKYLRSFGVPVALYEISLTTNKNTTSGNIEVEDKTKNDISFLLEEDS